MGGRSRLRECLALGVGLALVTAALAQPMEEEEEEMMPYPNPLERVGRSEPALTGRLGQLRLRARGVPREMWGAFQQPGFRSATPEDFARWQRQNPAAAGWMQANPASARQLRGGPQAPGKGLGRGMRGLPAVETPGRGVSQGAKPPDGGDPKPPVGRALRRGMVSRSRSLTGETLRKPATDGDPKPPVGMPGARIRGRSSTMRGAPQDRRGQAAAPGSLPTGDPLDPMRPAGRQAGLARGAKIRGGAVRDDGQHGAVRDDGEHGAVRLPAVQAPRAAGKALRGQRLQAQPGRTMIRR